MLNGVDNMQPLLANQYMVDLVVADITDAELAEFRQLFRRARPSFISNKLEVEVAQSAYGRIHALLMRMTKEIVEFRLTTTITASDGKIEPGPFEWIYRKGKIQEHEYVVDDDARLNSPPMEALHLMLWVFMEREMIDHSGPTDLSPMRRPSLVVVKGDA